MNEKNVVIDLSVNESGVLDDSAEPLQQGAYQKLKGIVAQQLNGIDGFSYRDIADANITYPRVHNAILIEGRRGSGKTTFLLRSLEKLKDDESLQLSVLKLIDPTLIETKENIVVVILSAIDTALAKVQGDIRALAEAKEALAGGLGLLDGIGASSAYGSEWEDSKWVMSQGLHKAKKGRDFEKKLGVYIELALELLRKKAFVLTFDDVDTNFFHGYIILETVRKYLTHPRLVVVLSGDIELYGRLLRKSIYGAFGDHVLRYDPDLTGLDSHSTGNAVLELEEQYLLKVVPPQNRINMAPLGGLKQYLDGGVEVLLRARAKKTAARVDVREWAGSCIRKLLNEPWQTGGHPFFNLVAMEPLRLVIGYMRALNVKDDSKYNSIFTAFSTRLNTQGVPADLISRGDLDNTLRVVFEWMMKQGDAPDLIRFGVSANVGRAIVMHCLALSVAQKLSGSSGNALKALFGLAMPIAMMRRPLLLDTDVRKSMFLFLWSNSAVTASELAARLGAIDRAGERGRKFQAAFFGSVGLVNRIQSKSILQNWYAEYEDVPAIRSDRLYPGLPRASFQWLRLINGAFVGSRLRYGVGWFHIDDLIENRCGRFGEVLRLVVSKRFNDRGEILRSVSALSLFGVIADLLIADDISELGSFAEFSVIPPFGEFNPFLGVPDYDVDEDVEFDEGDESVTDGNQNHYQVFMGKMKEWHAFSRSLEYKISPSVLGLLALRIHDDLLRFDEVVRSDWRSGEILHRQIICMLHGMLVTTSSVSGRKETPKTSDQVFIDILGRFFYEKLPDLMLVLLSCPLLWVFLNPMGLRCNRPLWEVAQYAVNNAGSNEGSIGVHIVGFEGETIEVSVGTSRRDIAVVEINTFYDLLNVVPRYASK